MTGIRKIYIIRHSGIIVDIETQLNNKQIEAVKTIDGPLLIIAGAGSGKTRVITYRIAYMLSKGIPQSRILALTFTNKASREMAERVKFLTGRKLSNLTISTFHAFGVKLLKNSIHKLGYKNNFSIYDSVDKISFIKEVAREISFPDDDFDAYSTANLFSAIKTGRIEWNQENSHLKILYREYQEHLKVFNAVDFDDLIVIPLQILQDYPDVLSEYHQRYQYIMVDEFQDTSLVQYRLMKIIAEGSRNICVVGDDDQSIYSWRGANYQNTLNFEHDFKELKEIKLEQNYRSTRNILAAANSLISYNKNRKKKELWTGMDHGKAIEIFYPDNEQEEADFISEMIKTTSIRDGSKYHDIGVLVRTNSLTTSIEEAFLSENIPYKVSGGISFFQRKEIKDIIAYLRIMANPDDDINFLRIINTPRRGLGKTTLLKIREIAEKRSCSLYSAVVVSLQDSSFPSRIKTDLDDFISLIEFHREKILKHKCMAETLKAMIDKIDYWGYLLQEYQKNKNTAKWKFGNINKFIQLFETWENDPDNLDPNIFSYLNKITLITRDDDSDSEAGRINLMTIHASKGLEFDTVFLPGVEENIIPHSRALEDSNGNIEEERRLFYVAITRAKHKLYITSCRRRRHLREVLECSPSPFLLEIPEDLIEFHEPEIPVHDDEAVDYFARLKERFS